MVLEGNVSESKQTCGACGERNKKRAKEEGRGIKVKNLAPKPLFKKFSDFTLYRYHW